MPHLYPYCNTYLSTIITKCNAIPVFNLFDSSSISQMWLRSSMMYCVVWTSILSVNKGAISSILEFRHSLCLDIGRNPCQCCHNFNFSSDCDRVCHDYVSLMQRSLSLKFLTLPYHRCMSFIWNC